jgi:hypothetical protein
MGILRKGKTAQELKIQEKWFDVRRVVKKTFDKRPDINAILFLIGINELGAVRETWEKEEKQDLMHIAICVLFKDFYEFTHKDEEGWPHFKATLTDLPNMLLKEQENALKERIIDYFLKKEYI